MICDVEDNAQGQEAGREAGAVSLQASGRTAVFKANDVNSISEYRGEEKHKMRN